MNVNNFDITQSFNLFSFSMDSTILPTSATLTWQKLELKQNLSTLTTLTTSINFVQLERPHTLQQNQHHHDSGARFLRASTTLITISNFGINNFENKFEHFNLNLATST